MKKNFYAWPVFEDGRIKRSFSARHKLIKCNTEILSRKLFSSFESSFFSVLKYFDYAICKSSHGAFLLCKSNGKFTLEVEDSKRVNKANKKLTNIAEISNVKDICFQQPWYSFCVEIYVEAKMEIEREHNNFEIMHLPDATSSWREKIVFEAIASDNCYPCMFPRNSELVSSGQ